MKKTIVTKLPAGDIIDIKKLDDGTYEIVQNVPEVSRNIPVSIFKDEETANKVRQLVTKSEVPDDVFVLVEAEALSLDDSFMRYEPQTKKEKKIKKLITDAINAKVKNFYTPKYAPSFSVDGKGLCFVAGKNPAVGESYKWWVNTARNYCPSRNSRLGTRLQYGAFLGVLIKKLVKEGQSFKEAWSSVCNDLRELEHYLNYGNANRKFEPTGSRCVCGFYDLANVLKILNVDGEASGFWLAGGDIYYASTYYPISVPDHCYYANYNLDFSVGWIVLD